jgi:hypothetical protein
MVNGDSFDAHVVHDACTTHMPALRARPEG